MPSTKLALALLQHQKIPVRPSEHRNPRFLIPVPAKPGTCCWELLHSQHQSPAPGAQLSSTFPQQFLIQISHFFPQFLHWFPARLFLSSICRVGRAFPPPPPPPPWQRAHLASMWQLLLSGIWQKSATFPVAIPATPAQGHTGKSLPDYFVFFFFLPKVWSTCIKSHFPATHSGGHSLHGAAGMCF